MKRLLLALGLLLAAVAAQVGLARLRPAGAASSVAEGAFAALGGLRSVAAEIVWFRADRLQEEGRYVELAQLAHALTLSEPHTPEVWSYAAWNLAYNVSVMMPGGEDRWRWVDAALTLLRDDALAYNPRSAELHRELAMLFELKIALDIDSEAATYRRHWSARVADVARRGAWDELKMEPVRMAALERAFGLRDRTDPLYSAVYWALEGLECARTDKERAMLNEVLRQSVMLYRRAREAGPRRG